MKPRPDFVATGRTVAAEFERPILGVAHVSGPSRSESRRCNDHP
jgi:hypothetical protein